MSGNQLTTDDHQDLAFVRLRADAGGQGLPDLRWELHDLVVAGARTIVVDLSTAPRVGSGAVGALLGAHRVCKARGGGVVIRDPGRQTLDLLQRTGLWRVFTVEQARRAATR